MSKKYLCPVCGFDGLNESPYDEKKEPSYEVCACCGFEFGLDEDNSFDKYKVYRLKWIEDGAKWFIADRKPKGWDLNKQLENIKEI